MYTTQLCMTALLAAAPLLTSSMAIPSIDTRSTDTLHVIWKYNAKAPKAAQVMLDIQDLNTEIPVVQHPIFSHHDAVSTYTVDTGVFAAKPLVLTVDKDQFYGGNITYNGNTYSVHGDQTANGAASCSRMYGPSSARIDCILPAASSGGLPAFTRSIAAEAEHFAGHMALGLPSHKQKLQSNSTFELLKARSELSSDNEKRQCTITQVTELEGDGDPHQNALDKQLSSTINCGAAPSCGAGQSDSISYTIGFSVSATAYQWLTGGFDVSETITTGNSYTCTGASGDNVCMWKNQAHTAYTVYNWSNDCGDITQGDDFVMQSPNNNNDGGDYYCVINACRNQGDSYWDLSGP